MWGYFLSSSFPDWEETVKPVKLLFIYFFQLLLWFFLKQFCTHELQKTSWRAQRLTGSTSPCSSRTSQIIQFQTLATARLPSSRWGTGSGCPGLIQAGLENHLDFRKVETNKMETVFHADFNSNWKSFLKFCQTCCWVTDIWVHLWPSPSQWDSFSAWEGYWMMTKLTFSCP